MGRVGAGCGKKEMGPKNMSGEKENDASRKVKKIKEPWMKLHLGLRSRSRLEELVDLGLVEPVVNLSHNLPQPLRVLHSRAGVLHLQMPYSHRVTFYTWYTLVLITGR